MLRYVLLFKSFKLKMTSTSAGRKVIGTHNGKFHCDEALACYMLRKLPEYSDAEIVRTRDAKVLDKCDVVVDVGGVYDPSQQRYDHHQRTFFESMNSLTEGTKPWVTKLSSAGLVYLHFGKRVISIITGGDPSSVETEELFDSVYSNFVEAVDGVDNGIESSDGSPRYKVTTTISHRISHLNPFWNSEDQDTDVPFKSAMELVGGEFTETVLYFKNVWMPARNIVKNAIDRRLEVDPSGEIIVLDTPCPWTDHLFSLEEATGIRAPIKYVLYKEQESSKWRVQAVPVLPNSFQSRLALHEPWRGVRDEELSKLSGIPGCVFVHSSGFIGANQTFDGALRMAQMSIQHQSARNN